MKILLIGGTKFIGPYVVRRLVELGHQVTIFHRGHTQADLPTGVERVYGGRKDLYSFRDQFAQLSIEVVLDMIAYTEADAKLLSATFNGIVERVVVVSSMDVYHAYDCFRNVALLPLMPIPFNEDSRLRENLFPYRASATSKEDIFYDYEKILVERVIMDEPALLATVLRLPAVYGPGDEQHRFYGYLKRMEDQRPAILLTHRQAQWRWTRGYVEDVAAAIVLAVTNSQAANQIYNIGEPTALSELEWVEAIAQLVGWQGKVVEVADQLMPTGLVPTYRWEQSIVADTSRIRKQLGYYEQIARIEALKSTIEWEQLNRPTQIDAKMFDYQGEDMVLAHLLTSND
ncbi:MAG: NAD-dependent epimerase/dehydratase family protein [Acidobacteriota bacterium]